MKRAKPSVNDVKALNEACQKIYGPLFGEYDRDETFYELEFVGELGIPQQYISEAVVLPTARDMVDAFVDHIDIANARVFVNKKSIHDVDEERAEMMRRFYLGLLHRWETESSVSEWRVGAKHYANHGIAVMKTIWVADEWFDKPIQNKKESDEAYGERIEKWMEDKPPSLPIKLIAVNPANIMPDPSYGGRLYVIERHQRLVFDVQKMYPDWPNSESRKIDENVEYLSYWDSEFRCDLIDGQPVLPGKVVKHGYGFIPYTIIESGLGNHDKDSRPEKRYVGINRYARDLYISESRNYSVTDVQMKKDAWRGGYVQGEGAEQFANVKQEYGTYPYVPEGVVFHHWDENDTYNRFAVASGHLATTAELIGAHAAPRSVRGLSETGVRSGADRRLVISEAAAKFQYSKEAFKHGAEQVLIKCARLYKNVVPENVRLWALPTTGEGFDAVIKKDMMKEPFTCYVEFAPISEEDEYRRQDANNKLWNNGNGYVTKQWVRRQDSRIDPIAMEEEDRMNMIRQLPSYLATLDQAVGMMAQNAFQLPLPLTQEGAQDTGSPPEGGQRPLVPRIPSRAPLGSAENISQNMPQAPVSGIRGSQGQGGGGNR